MDGMISKYVSYAEATRSETAKRLGLENKPNSKQLAAMRNVATKVFDPVREFIGGALYPSSFFRSPNLNANVAGSSKTSQHMLGEAIDIDAHKYGNGTNKDIFNFIKDNLEFDQLIWEFGTDEEPDWVHVSLKLEGRNRREVLKAIKSPTGKTIFRKLKT